MLSRRTVLSLPFTSLVGCQGVAQVAQPSVFSELGQEGIKYGPNFKDDINRLKGCTINAFEINAPSFRDNNSICWRNEGVYTELDIASGGISLKSIDVVDEIRVGYSPTAAIEPDFTSAVDTRLDFTGSGAACTLYTARIDQTAKCTAFVSDSTLENWSAIALPGRAGIICEDRQYAAENIFRILSFENYGHIQTGKVWLNNIVVHKGSPPLLHRSTLLDNATLLAPLHSGGQNFYCGGGGRTAISYPVSSSENSATVMQLVVLDGEDNITSKRTLTRIPGAGNDAHCSAQLLDIGAGRILGVFGGHNSRATYKILTGGSYETNLHAEQVLPLPPGDYTYPACAVLPDKTIFYLARRRLPDRRYQLFSSRFLLKDDLTLELLSVQPLIDAVDLSYVNFRHRCSISTNGGIAVSATFWPNLLTATEAKTIATTSRTKWCKFNRCIYLDVPHLYPTLFISRDYGKSFLFAPASQKKVKA